MWHEMNVYEVLRKQDTNEKTGLSIKEVEIRKQKYGNNQLAEREKESFFVSFIKQFNDFTIIILIIASVISLILAKVNGTNDYVDSIIIIGIVIFNAVLGLIQESKAEKSIEALQKMSSPTAKVKRDGKIFEIPTEELVPGDIILLEAGKFVPADCRLISSHQLKIEEASLTGENIPVQKDAHSILKSDVSMGDMINMAFSTTIVMNGHGEAVVTETGMNTKVGEIAGMIMENESPETPIQKKLAQVGKSLGVICLAICFLIFIIGIFKQIEIKEMFMTSVGLAVAAIPEGLPAIVTIVLSIGVTRMAKKNAIIRKLPAVETLGSSSVICSDKTGTLTQNKMTVVNLSNINGKIEDEHEKKFLLELGTMCTDCIITRGTKKGQTLFGPPEVDGEPTERAIVQKALDFGQNKNELYQMYERIADIPFNSERKLMSTIHKTKNGYRVITKGAPDVLLNKCQKYYFNGSELAMESNHKNKIKMINENMAKEALRVLAVAYKDVVELPEKIDENLEDNLVFVGLIGMIDPPREGVKESIRVCKNAGVKTVMITGDHIITAKAIARELGILNKNDLAITGKELDELSDEQLNKNIMKYSVFARVSPEHKVRIVNSFKNAGNVVGMTGDGVNDAPALKNADIGIAMGNSGTDVAKNAADMILTDDNFVTIVSAVKEGRNIYDNIKKAVHFLIATNVGEIVTIFLGLLLGLESPLLAIQLLWINLVTDSIPAIALGLENPEIDIMDKKPKDPKKGLFSDGLWGNIFVEGTMIGILTLLAFSFGNNQYGLEVGRTMAFICLGMLELVHSFNIKSDQSIFKAGLLENKYLIGAFLLGTVLQCIVVCIPVLADVFKLVPLGLMQWLCCIAISLLPLIIVELQKKLNEIRFGRTIYNYKEKRIETINN